MAGRRARRRSRGRPRRPLTGASPPRKSPQPTPVPSGHRRPLEPRAAPTQRSAKAAASASLTRTMRLPWSAPPRAPRAARGTGRRGGVGAARNDLAFYRSGAPRPGPHGGPVRTQRSATLASASATASGASVAAPSPAAACSRARPYVVGQCALDVRRAEVQAQITHCFLHVDRLPRGRGPRPPGLPRARRLSARLLRIAR